MSLASIEARALEFMGQHKGDLATLLAKAEAKLVELGHDVEALFSDDAPGPDLSEPSSGGHAMAAMEQGTDPEIIDIAPASVEPEVLDEHGQWIPAPPATKVEYTGGALTDAQAVAVFQGEEQPSVEMDVGWHMATLDSELPNAAVEGADAAPAEPEAQ